MLYNQIYTGTKSSFLYSFEYIDYVINNNFTLNYFYLLISKVYYFVIIQFVLFNILLINLTFNLCYFDLTGGQERTEDGGRRT